MGSGIAINNNNCNNGYRRRALSAANTHKHTIDQIARISSMFSPATGGSGSDFPVRARRRRTKAIRVMTSFSGRVSLSGPIAIAGELSLISHDFDFDFDRCEAAKRHQSAAADA